MKRAALALTALLACAGSPKLEPPAPLAGMWRVVDGDSVIHFVGIKNNAVGVLGVFTSVSGSFDPGTGNAGVEVKIASLFTNDSVRDANLRAHFFEDAKFPVARFSVAKLPQLAELPAEGQTKDYELSGTLELHGTKLPLVVPARVTHERGARLRVRNRVPIVLSAKDLGMESQLAVLKAVCGHESLSGAVPVDVDVVFAPAAPG